MNIIKYHYELLRTSVNNSLATKEPFQLITITATSVLATVWFYEFIFEGNEGKLLYMDIIFYNKTFIVIDVKERIKKAVFKLLKLIPQVRKKIDSELDKVSQSFENEVRERTKHLKYITELPDKGKTSDEILQITDKNLGLGMYLKLPQINFLYLIYVQNKR